MKTLKTIALGIVLSLVAATSNGQAPRPSCGKVHASTGVNVGVNNGTMNVVNLLNRQRAKKGLYPYIMDPGLQRTAARRAILTGATGRFRGHPAGSFTETGARMEGVGSCSGTNPTAVYSCGTYGTKYRYVGAAMVFRNGRSFFSCVYK